MKTTKTFIGILFVILILTACSNPQPNANEFGSVATIKPTGKPTTVINNKDNEIMTTDDLSSIPSYFDFDAVPDFNGEPFVVINNNAPWFNDTDITEEPFEQYSNLDKLGRCGVAFANICLNIMPKKPRGEIGMIKPSGWHNHNYHDLIDGNYIYNRCHLIGYQLSGENANEKNLITGTRYMNVEGMEPFENQTADYVRLTGHHVLYRVTPIFINDELVARGVLMEAQSVEDDDLTFCVYCYNVQPYITIDYATGENWITE